MKKISLATATTIDKITDKDRILPPLLSIVEVCEYLHLGETKVREMIRLGEIRHTRVRSRIRVFATDLRAYLDSNMH